MKVAVFNRKDYDVKDIMSMTPSQVKKAVRMSGGRASIYDDVRMFEAFHNNDGESFEGCFIRIINR